VKELVLASGNAGKLREFNALFTELGWRVRPQSDFAVPECPEPHVSFVENALAKARHASRHSGLPALADGDGPEEALAVGADMGGVARGHGSLLHRVDMYSM